MKILSNDSILKFTQGSQFPRISIYLPTHRGGQETQQDPIRLKNLIREARQGLNDAGVASEEADKLLAPVVEVTSDTSFLKHLQDGLAILASSEGMRHFHLPYNAPERVVISDQFHLRPLLPLIGSTDRFYVLALNKSHMGLYEANRYSMRGVQVDEMPTSLAEALRFDDGESQLQYHVSGPTASPAPGKSSTKPITANAAVFHGQGGEKDVHHDQLLRFFRLVDRGLHDFLRDKNAPLILAGVEYYFPIFRQVNSYPHLFEKGVSGSTEGFSTKELHEKAWELLSSKLEHEENEVIERFEQLAASNNGNGARTVQELDGAVTAAYEGRVDALLVPEDAQEWGSFDEENVKVTTETEPRLRKELFDYASQKTLQNGGTLYLIPREKMPSAAPVGAILRYRSGKVEEMASG